MATNKIERIDREITKTREKLAEYQKSCRNWKRRKPRRRTWKSSSWCARSA